MKDLNTLQKEEQEKLCTTYSRYPLAIKSGKGSKLYDFENKEYIDLLTGIACTCLGHANEELAETMYAQAKKLIHVSNLFYQEEQLEFAQKLINHSGHLKKVFFCNSGAEANEALIKMARRYSHKVKNSKAFEIITLDHAFHGRTLATLAATGQAKFQDGFEPIPTGFKQVEWGNLEILEKAITKDTAGILVEIIQGEGGVRPMPKEYAEGIEALCKKHNILFLVDEVQTGLCRTGKFWAHQHYELKPDIISSAKSLANGLPLGAILCTEEVSKAFEAGSHATTFGGNAFCTAVGTKVIEIIERDNLEERTYLIGDALIERFNILKKKYPNSIKEVRGLGLMIGIDLAFEAKICKEIWTKLLDKGYILNLTQETTLRLLPALNIEEENLNAFAFALEDLIKEYIKK